MAVIRADSLFDKIAPALGLESCAVRRIIIDLNVREAVQVYVEMYGDDRLFNIDWAELKDAEVTILERGK